MASISSRFYHFVPPFLRAFKLSNQSLAFLQYRKVSIINDHCPLIHTKPPSPPLPLFLSRNQPFSHFLSVAAAAAILDEQRHRQPSTCLDACEMSEFVEKEITGNVPIIAPVFPSPISSPSPSLMTLNGREGMEYFSLKLEEERRREISVLGELHLVSQFPFRGRIQVTCLDACEMSEFFEKEIARNVPIIAPVFPSPISSPFPSLMALNGRKGMEYFSLKLKEERRREISVLEELHLVSQFPFRGRIQLLIKLRFMRQELTTVMYQQLSENLRERFDAGSHIFLLREHDMNEFPSGAAMEIQLFDSYFSIFLLPKDHSDDENNQCFLELILTQAFYSRQTFFTKPFGHKDQHKRQSLEAFWGGQKPLYCDHMMQTRHTEAPSMRKKRPSRKQYVASTKRNRTLHPSNLRKGCG